MLCKWQRPLQHLASSLVSVVMLFFFFGFFFMTSWNTTLKWCLTTYKDWLSKWLEEGLRHTGICWQGYDTACGDLTGARLGNSRFHVCLVYTRVLKICVKLLKLLEHSVHIQSPKPQEGRKWQTPPRPRIFQRANTSQQVMTQYISILTRCMLCGHPEKRLRQQNLCFIFFVKNSCQWLNCHSFQFSTCKWALSSNAMMLQFLCLSTVIVCSRKWELGWN